MKIRIYNCNSGCPIQNTLQFISGKWKCIIIYQLLRHKIMRFSDFQHIMPYTSRRMIARQLNELERTRIIYKIIHPAKSIKTEYILTNFGKSFSTIIQSMEIWGNKYKSQVDVLSNGKKC